MAKTDSDNKLKVSLTWCGFMFAGPHTSCVRISASVLLYFTVQNKYLTGVRINALFTREHSVKIQSSRLKDKNSKRNGPSGATPLISKESPL